MKSPLFMNTKWKVELSGLYKGELQTRTAEIRQLYANNIACFEALDGQKPEVFFAKDAFTWHSILQRLMISWKSGTSVPSFFRPLKRIPDEVITNMQLMSTQDKLTVIQGLRDNRFLPPLLPLQRGTEPEDTNWINVRELCLLPTEDRENKEDKENEEEPQ